MNAISIKKRSFEESIQYCLDKGMPRTGATTKGCLIALANLAREAYLKGHSDGAEERKKLDAKICADGIEDHFKKSQARDSHCDSIFLDCRDAILSTELNPASGAEKGEK